MAPTEQTSFVGGLSIAQRNEDVANLLKLSRNDGYEFCTTSLPHLPDESDKSRSLITKRPRRDLMSLDSKWWCTSIVGEVVDEMKSSFGDESTTANGSMMQMQVDSPSDTKMSWPGFQLVEDICNVNDSLVRKHAERIFRSSLAWASHMNIPAVIVPTMPLDAEKALNYARVLSGLSLSCSASNVQLWVRVPFHAEYLEGFELLCRRCDTPSNLGCLVCFGMEIPQNIDLNHLQNNADSGQQACAPLHISSINLLHKFIGHNLKAVSFNTASFLTNKRGYPTLSKAYQLLFTELLRRIGRTCRILVEGGSRHRPPNAPDANGETGCLAYLQYLRHLRTRPEVTGILDSADSAIETPYLDHLQSPLQPLGDNLEFSTYEIFEKDPVKYRNYQTAVEFCLREKSMKLANTKKSKDVILPFEQLSMNEKVKYGNGFTHLVTILVVGAGRGPLIRSSLAAVEALNRQQHHATPPNMQPSILLKAHVIAIEKNPSAVLFLRALCQSEEHWDDDTVSIVDCDMRNAETHPLIQKIIAKRKQNRSQFSGNDQGTGIADVIVSELLGSFGDNELSPECLDGAQRTGLLKSDCVSIPEEYTSYIAPVSSFRLHSEARAQAYSPSSSSDGPEGQPFGTLRALETPYVVRAHAASQTHKEKPCFTFTHIKTLKSSSNDNAMTESNMTKTIEKSSTALAVMNVDNERYTVLEFGFDQTYGAGSGCGYGSFDNSVATMAQISRAGSQATGQATDLNSPIGTTIHGFFGTFEAILYRSKFDDSTTTISIAPSSFSEGMFSWFPLFFPIRTPLFVPVGDTLRCAFWRKTDTNALGTSGKVWYEWCCEVVKQSPGQHETNGNIISALPVHNPNGRSYQVRL